MPRKKQRNESKCVAVNISMDERLLEKVDSFVTDTENMYFRGNRSNFISFAILKFFEHQEQTENKEKK
jgi:metal-responsive CopG/Arc/MetJ family transcriptional regulator